MAEGNLKTSRETRDLRVLLTTEEKASYADKIAGLREDLDRTEEEKKSAMADYKGQIDSINEQISKLSSEVRRGQERPVTVECIYNYDTGQYTEVRTDTAEVLVTREMTESERQLHFPNMHPAKSGPTSETLQ